MEITEQRYYGEPHTLEFEARVLSCQAHGDNYHVVLDSSCFYPEGGGQPADKGAIADIPVLDVQINDGIITHTLPMPIKEGKVHASVDPHWRYTYMQQHSGQHLLSAALHKIGNFKTKSVHLGEEYSTIEIEGTDITAQEVAEAERLALKSIEKNRSIRTFFIKEGQEKEYSLRRSIKKKGSIRLVEIEGFDVVGCGGIHCQKTGQIKLIKHISTEKIRGNTRLYWMIGERAIQDYAQKHSIVASLNTLLSTQDDSLYDAVVKLQDKIQSQQQELQVLKAAAAEAQIEKLLKSTESCHYLSGTGRNELQLIAQGLSKRTERPLFLLSSVDNKIHWFFINGQIDLFQEIKDKVLPLLNAKGGGKPPMFQGGGEQTDQLEAAMKSLSTILEN